MRTKIKQKLINNLYENDIVLTVTRQHGTHFTRIVIYIQDIDVQDMGSST